MIWIIICLYPFSLFHQELRTCSSTSVLGLWLLILWTHSRLSNLYWISPGHAVTLCLISWYRSTTLLHILLFMSKCPFFPVHWVEMIFLAYSSSQETRLTINSKPSDCTLTHWGRLIVSQKICKFVAHVLVEKSCWINSSSKLNHYSSAFL